MSLFIDVAMASHLGACARDNNALTQLPHQPELTGCLQSILATPHQKPSPAPGSAFRILPPATSPPGGSPSQTNWGLFFIMENSMRKYQMSY